MSKIWIVDDEISIRNLFYEAFHREGHEVTTIARGEQLFAMLRKEHPDLLLMDINIPGEEGLSLLKRMPQDISPKIPVVILSGFISRELEQEALALGALKVLRKDSHFRDIQEEIKKVLRGDPVHGADLPQASKGTILIVDDDPGILTLLSTFWTQKGFRTVKAKHGFEALRLLEEIKPSIILLDITMPGMDGILTLKKIKEKDRSASVIMITGIHDESVAQEAMSLGAHGYVPKPFNFDYLEWVVLTRLTLAG